MGLLGQCTRLVLFVIAPLITIFIAAGVGYLSATEYPLGTVFYFLGKLMPGTKNTPPVPANFALSPRPAKEMFVDLPSGLKMPMIGLGLCCRPTAYDHDSVVNSVLWFLTQGGRLLDGAQLYLNHAAVGEGIKEAEVRGIPRKDIFVTTKVFPGHDFGYSGTTKWVDKMLQELQLEYVDLVLIHFPRYMFGMFSEETEFKGMGMDCVSAQDCRAGTWKALSEAREQGKIKEIGVSNFRPVHMEHILSLNLAPIAVHQLQFHPWLPAWYQEIVDFCRAHDIKMTGYFSLGVLHLPTLPKANLNPNPQNTYKRGATNTARSLTHETLTSIANLHNSSPSQVMLRWSLQKGVSVIPGSGNPTHMKENLAAYDFELSAESMDKIDALSADPIMHIPEWYIAKE